MKAAFVGRTIAKKGDRYLITAPVVGAKTGPHRHRDAAADNATGAQHANVKIGNVHGAAFALAIAGRLAKEFGHHAVKIAPFGDHMAMAAMGADDVIIVSQRGADPCPHRLLANVQVDKAGQLPLAKKLAHLLLKTANA